MSELRETDTFNAVVDNDHTAAFITEIHAARYADVVFNPIDNPSATEQLLERRKQWAEDHSSTVIFTSGVYDLFHPNHMAYLLHTKAAGAPVHYEKSRVAGDPSWEELSLERIGTLTKAYIQSGALKQIVGIRGDASVAATKGFRSDKGNSPRPIYDWDSRAVMMAHQTVPFQLSDGSWQFVPTVDAITSYGSEEFDANHPHHNLYSLTEAIQPDVWAIFGESADILEKAPLIPSLGGVALRRIIENGEDTAYYLDSYVGNFHTTAIIERIQQGK